ncbi:hypothetical protein LCGC14_2450620, partial [marine sediment metagenome]
MYPANPLQQVFLAEALHHVDPKLNISQFIDEYHQPIDSGCFRQAWAHMLRAFPALRTCFDWETELLQIIPRYSEQLFDKTFSYLDMSATATSKGSTEEQVPTAIDTVAQQAWEQGFALDQPGLIHVQLIKWTDDHYYLVRTIHHAIWDGWCEVVFNRRFHQLYEAYRQQQTPVLTIDNAYGQAQHPPPALVEQTQAFWASPDRRIDQANNINAMLTAPLASAAASPTLLIEQADAISGTDYQALQLFCRQYSITANTVVQFAWHWLVHCYSGDASSCVGTTVFGRALPITGIDESIGLYINTLPFSIHWENDYSVLKQLTLIQQQLLDLQQHTHIPLASLQTDG